MELLSSSHFQPKSEPWVLREMFMTKNLLVIGAPPDSAWVQALRQGLRPPINLDVIQLHEAEEGTDGEGYDLILLDYSAAGDAFRVLSRLRQLRPSTPIVVVSASPTWQQAREVFAAGATDYISKTLDLEELQAAFEGFFQRFS
jgi:DNA-binding response OmpR family regulator